MDVALTLAQDPQVIVYFVTLGVSMVFCFRGCTQRWSVAASILSMSVTWFYICRWTVEYKEAGGTNLFDDAYVDVLQGPHVRTSSQLLTWVVVATVWMHDAPPCYMLFGMLGAMSAAFLTWVPNRPSGPSCRRVSVLLLPCSLLALLCVHQLPRALGAGAMADFSFWLALLHVLLVLPQLAACLLPASLHRLLLPDISGSALLRLLALLVTLGHWCDPLLRPPLPLALALPSSDCQLSISCDLLLCALITLYAVHKDSGGSAAQAGGAALLLTVLPPGAVLALHLSRQQRAEGLHSSLVTWLQELCARRRAAASPPTLSVPLPSPMWMNLGQGWGAKDVTYEAACQQLAATLGNHLFRAGDGVLACGCGYGAELLFWKQAFSLGHVTGIDSNPRASRLFPPTRDVRLLPVAVSDICHAFEGKVTFSKIVALDSVYHFENKAGFFRDCARLLPPGGRVGVTDLLLRGSAQPPWWLRLLLRAMHVNVEALWSEAEYRGRLEEQGWREVQVKPFEAASVLQGWFPSSLLNHLQYAVVSASRPACTAADAPPSRTRPRVAVVGSGLSGLVAAQALAGTHDVTIFEASERGGLSGQGALVQGQLVDVPLRIIGQGYYRAVERLARGLHVRLEPIRADHLTQTHYAPARRTFCYSHSNLENFFSLLPYVSELLAFRDNLYPPAAVEERAGEKKRGREEGGEKCETWGEWMARHGYATDMYQGAGSAAPARAPAGEGCQGEGEDSYLMWLLMGQASWMLSCPYQAVLDYPAHVLLDFFCSLGVGEGVADSVLASGSQAGRMLRIKPSMQALELALTYGLKIRCDCQVSEVGADRVVLGEVFDAVVVATEASAVPRVLAGAVCAPVFSSVQYQASAIYLHTDTSLLPAAREDWRAFNINQDPTQHMCMLTAWLNQYYQDSAFDCDVFQTWNPHVIPAPEHVLKVVHFQRVVHSADTPRLLREIAALQGQHGIYYAGAYCEEGMGLLEQAAVSGQRAAASIIAASAAAAAAAAGKEELEGPTSY